MWLLVVIFSVCCHEYAHAQMALWQGDSTAADEGHLTLNPLKQMGVLSLIMLVLVGIAFGSVPVNPRLMRRRYSEALVAFAGPLMNLALFFIFCVLACAVMVLQGSEQHSTASNAFLFFVTGAILNVVLFLFNMLPIPPLDGWAVFRYLFPGLQNINPELLNGAMVGLFILAFFSFNYFYRIGVFLTQPMLLLFCFPFEMLKII